MAGSDLAALCPALGGLPEECLVAILACSEPLTYEPGERLFGEGDVADRFYIVESGCVNLELNPAGRGTLMIQTVRSGEILGWSWLFPPYLWHFDGRAVEGGAALSVDAACLQARLQSEPELGYLVMSRFATVLMQRLQATRKRLLDLG